jgi:hypothetical protein
MFVDEIEPEARTAVRRRRQLGVDVERLGWESRRHGDVARRA